VQRGLKKVAELLIVSFGVGGGYFLTHYYIVRAATHHLTMSVVILAADNVYPDTHNVGSCIVALSDKPAAVL